MSFAAIRGQNRAVAALRRSLAADRMAHAVLFAGPSGVGKMTAAEAFAKALLCHNEGDTACGECTACRKVDHGNHPDLHLVVPEGAGRQIRIDVVRQRVVRELGLKPFESDHKIVLIDDADAMNDLSANCLLKTLEEPPPGSVLVLVTARPDALLETIVSRCRVVRFGLLALEVIEELLIESGIDADSARFLARTSGGSVGRAKQMAEQADLPAARKTVLGLLTNLTTRNIVASSAALTKCAQGLAETKAEARSAAEWLLDLAELFYRDVALRQLSVGDGSLSNTDAMEQIDAETPISPFGVRAIVDTIEETKGLLRSNVDLEAALVDACSRIAQYRAQRQTGQTRDR
jgi:DNA polymerase-3 subunit delta'